MSEIAQAAFEEYFSKFDPYGNEWQDRDASQIFVDGFDAGAAQLAAIKKENERLTREKDNLLVLLRRALDAGERHQARVAELEEKIDDLGYEVLAAAERSSS